MTFGADLAAGLAELRDLAGTRMRGTCLIDREDGRTRDEYGRPVPQYVTVYEGKGYARYPGIAHEQNLESAGADVTVSRVIYRIPLGAVVRPGDRLTITADPDNPQLEGARFRVASIDDQSQATAQRLLCEDFQAGSPAPEES